MSGGPDGGSVGFLVVGMGLARGGGGGQLDLWSLIVATRKALSRISGEQKQGH